MLPVLYPILRDDPAVSALVGTRIYRHGAAPQQPVAPYITWFIVTGTPENVLGERPRIDNYQVQVDCWSNNTGTGDTEIEELAEAVRDALEAVADMTAIAVDERDFETQRYRLGMTFTFWTHRPQLSS